MTQETKATKVMKGILIGVGIIVICLGVAAGFMGGSDGSQSQPPARQAPAGTAQGW